MSWGKERWLALDPTENNNILLISLFPFLCLFLIPLLANLSISVFLPASLFLFISLFSRFPVLLLLSLSPLLLCVLSLFFSSYLLHCPEPSPFLSLFLQIKLSLFVLIFPLVFIPSVLTFFDTGYTLIPE